MTKLFEKSIRTLELPRVLSLLSDLAVSQAAKDRALATTPAITTDDVARLQDQTDTARALIGQRGAPSFSGLKPVAES